LHYIQRARMHIHMIDEVISHRGGVFTSIKNMLQKKRV